MAGPVNNAFSSRKKALAFENQSAAGTGATITSADCLDVSSISWAPQTQRQQDPRYTGSIHRSGDIILGATYDVTFEWLIHGHGAGAVPAADAFIPGRVLKALGFTENRFATAIAAEAYSSGTDTALTLGTTAVGTADLYNGLIINIDDLAAEPDGFAMIRDYSSSKVATLARDRTIDATGDYSIPAQLAYTLAAAEAQYPASITVWEGDNAGSGHRLNFIDMRPMAATIELMTASRDNANAYCKVTCTFSGVLSSEATEAVPTVSTAIPIPPFRGGQQDIANVQLGGSSVVIDLGIRSAFPPNPNQADGNDPGIVVETKRTVRFELNKVSRSVVDWTALADAQAQHAAQFIWGIGSGNYMGILIDQMRFDYPATNEGADFITQTGTAEIDGVDKAISITFPIWS